MNAEKMNDSLEGSSFREVRWDDREGRGGRGVGCTVGITSRDLGSLTNRTVERFS